MGCEAYMTVASIISGHHLIDPADPVFRVREPVAIIGASVYPFGQMWSFHAQYPYQDLIGYSSLSGEMSSRIHSLPLCIGIPEERCPVFGIQVWPRDLFEALNPDWRKSPPGSVVAADLEAAWGKITPGIWGVTEYRTEGAGDEYFGWYKRGVDVESPIEWEIWT